MRLELGEEGDFYESAAQQARAWTEGWVSGHLFCPACGADHLSRHKNNQPAADFFCAACAEQFELKSKNGRFGVRVVDGAYATLLGRLEADDNPNLVLLAYNRTRRSVDDLTVVPRFLFVPSIVEPRKPLASTARRAGWVGCNILLAGIPDHGRIDVVKGGAPVPRDRVLAQWRQMAFLREEQMASRGWLIEVLRCVEEINRPEFSLADVYAFESRLQSAFPGNSHVRDKIRQQLQRLRDRGVIEFLGGGEYRLTPKA